MIPFLLTTAAAVMVLGSMRGASAFETIFIPSEVQAGQPTEVAVENDLDSGADSFDAGFSDYRLYLAVTPPGWGTGPGCWLVNSTTIDVTRLSVTIPAGVAPDGTDLAVATMEFNTDPDSDYGPSGFEYSNDFTFFGGDGQWSKMELSGQGLCDPDNCPCTAVPCVRSCALQFPGALGQDNISAQKAFYECSAACPGVTYPPWDSDSSGGSGDSDNTSTGTAFATPPTTIPFAGLPGVTSITTPVTALPGITSISTPGASAPNSTFTTSSASPSGSASAASPKTGGSQPVAIVSKMSSLAGLIGLVGLMLL